jgi:hypothetical protein
VRHPSIIINFRYPRIRELMVDNDAIALGNIYMLPQQLPHLLPPLTTIRYQYLVALSCPKAGTRYTVRIGTVRIGTPNSPKTAKIALVTCP